MFDHKDAEKDKARLKAGKLSLEEKVREDIRNLIEKARGPKGSDIYNALQLREAQAHTALLAEILFELRSKG